MPDHATLRFVPFSVDVRVYGQGGHEVCEPPWGHYSCGRITKGAFVRLAVQLQFPGAVSDSAAGNAEMYHRSGLIIWREQGLLYDAGSAVPLLMS